jgi:hypothetical protein
MSFEAAYGQSHQLRTQREIPVGIFNMNVPEVSGQNRQTGFDILARSIPFDECSNGEPVA